MRNVVIAGLVSCLAVAGCEEKKEEAPAAPASAPSAAPIAPAPVVAKKTMAEMQLAVNKTFADAFNAHDAKKIGAGYTEDAVIRTPGMPEIKGREAIIADAQGYFTGIPDMKWAIARAWQKGDVEVVEWVATGTNTGPLSGNKPTGRSVGLNAVSILTFSADGLVKEERQYFDFVTLGSQLDAKAPAGSFRPPATLPASTEMHVAKDDAATLAKVNEVYTVMDGHAADPLVAFWADDAPWDDFSAPAAIKGKKAMKDAVMGYFKAFPDLKQNNSFQLVADGWVMSEGVLVGTHKGALGPLKATNKPVSIHYVDFWQVKDGKITSARTYQNALELLVEIGAAPAPGAPPAASAAKK